MDLPARPIVRQPGAGSNDREDTFMLKDNLAIYGGFEGDEPGTLDGRKQRDPEQWIVVLDGDINMPNDFSDNSYNVVTSIENLSSAQLHGVTIRGGNAVGGPTGVGGGIIILPGLATAVSSSPVIARCKFVNNVAEFGGAVFYDAAFQDSIGRFINCSFIGNFATARGGAAYNSSNHCDCLPNQWPPAGWEGGADHCTSLTFQNCLFWGNGAAYDGGAVFAEIDSGTSLINCTVFGNQPDGLEMQGNENCGKIRVLNSILWANGSGSLADQISGPFEEGNTSIQGISSPPPSFEDAANGDFRLKCDSVNEINTNGASAMIADWADLDKDDDVSEVTPLDLALKTREVPSGRVDRGAFERTTPCDADTNGDGHVDVIDLLAVINQWGACGSCNADVDPGPCGFGDGIVNVQDLLMVIENWGDNCSGDGEVPESIEDCFEFCASFQGEDWERCMNGCIESVCDKHPEECE